MRFLRLFMLLMLTAALLLLAGQGRTMAQSSTPLAPHACEDGAQESGAVYRICLPASWNGTLGVFLHGYVPPTAAVGIPEGQLQPPGWPLSIDQLLTLQGYAFVMSSYRTTGLAIQPAIADTLDAIEIFRQQHGDPTQILLFGLSDGGLVTTLMMERYPAAFRGGMALCGPYASFIGQTDYLGDFRILFDYFFPEIEIPDSPIAIAPAVIADWDAFYASEIAPVVTAPANAPRVDQLLTSAGAAFDPADAASKERTIYRLLWYNVFATNDAIAKLGGQPFDNAKRVYSGSADDAALNTDVARYAADPAVRQLLADEYESTGELRAPLMTVHNLSDPVVPYAQAERYADKVQAAGSEQFYRHLPVASFGHCTFSQVELLAALQAFEELLASAPPFSPQGVYLPLVTRN